MPIEQKIDALVENFDLFDDWEERYGYLIELGKKLPELEEADRIDANKVKGCVSQVWLVASDDQADPNIIHFKADSDAHIVRGLIAVLLDICSGQSKQEIQAVDLGDIFQRLGLKEHLSPSRSNGFYAMIERIKLLSGEY